MTHPICPRCEGFIPSNERPGEYPGALSRADNETEICSKCGTDEAMRQYMAGEMIPASEWPVIDPHEYRNIVHAQAVTQ